MSIPSPLQQYHFHVILIWWHSPFKLHLRYTVNKNEWMKETFHTVWKQNRIDNTEKKTLWL
jgi:hypothetical protein